MSQYHHTNLTGTGPKSNPDLCAERPTANRLNKDRVKKLENRLNTSKDSFPTSQKTQSTSNTKKKVQINDVSGNNPLLFSG